MLESLNNYKLITKFSQSENQFKGMEQNEKPSSPKFRGLLDLLKLLILIINKFSTSIIIIIKPLCYHVIVWNGLIST